MVIKIKDFKDGIIETWYGDKTIDNNGNIIDELNSRLSGGFKITDIEYMELGETVYTLEADKEHKYIFTYHDLENEYFFRKVVDACTADMIKTYYGGCLSQVFTDFEDEEVVEDYEFKSEFSTLIDMRRKSEEEIEGEFSHYKLTTNFYVLDAIEEDINNM